MPNFPNAEMLAFLNTVWQSEKSVHLRENAQLDFSVQKEKSSKVNCHFLARKTKGFLTPSCLKH
jgi:hypothetical protein